MKFILIVLFGVILTGCASAPKFNVIDVPGKINAYEISSNVVWSNEYKNKRFGDWIEVKGAMTAKDKGCTHFRVVSHEYSHYTTSYIFSCVDVNSISDFTSSSNHITVTESDGTVNSQTFYTDLEFELFKNRDLVEHLKSLGH